MQSGHWIRDLGLRRIVITVSADPLASPTHQGRLWNLKLAVQRKETPGKVGAFRSHIPYGREPTTHATLHENVPLIHIGVFVVAHEVVGTRRAVFIAIQRRTLHRPR